jgi:hypothetical protein
MRIHLALSFSLASLALACPAPSVELAGRACDPDHSCIDGYVCSPEGLCLERGADGSVPTDAGSSDAGSCERAFCEAKQYFACERGRPVLAATCAEDERCDLARGCLVACDEEGGCSTGKACDRASDSCVTVPACGPELDCTSGTCIAGACVPTPSGPAQVGASEAAGLDCYPDGLEPTPGAPATFRGYVLDGLGKKTAATVGCVLSLWEAERFASAEGEPLATAPVVEREYQGGSGPEPAGGFEVPDVPTGVALVAVIDGCANMLPTHQYFALPPAAQEGSAIDQDLTAFGRAEWQSLLEAAGATVGENRAAIAGQIFDCGEPPRRLRGATAALDTPTRAYYTYPAVLGIDPAARATADNGRFFFFDVPATALRLVTAERDAQARLFTQTLEVRTVPGALTLVSVRPAGR